MRLILGGVRSGKSTRAVALVRKSGKKRVFFLATARRTDAEMTRRIAAHRRERPAAWTTIEEPIRVPEKLAALPKGATVIVDCVTLWIGGLVARNGTLSHIELRVNDFCAAARRRKLDLTVISNEVGSGVIPPTRLGRRFEDALGMANARLAAASDRVELMVAGLPVTLKPSRR